MKRILQIIWLLLVCVATGISYAGAQTGGAISLMPVPAHASFEGGRFGIRGSLGVRIEGQHASRLDAEAARFVRRFSERTGLFPDRPVASVSITVQRPASLILGEDESYSLRIDDKQIRLISNTDIGAIRGLETVLQLLSADAAGYYFPSCTIEDHPRFAWRGLLLDVALHFMPVDEIERTLDGMAAVKMNVLHLHLCNDQGFRVESKVFPRLNKVSSEGQFYTQEEIRHLVRYADQRGIRIVPEFVVPAHTTAILTARPDLASVKRDYRLQRYFGVFDPVMDPTNAKVYAFLDSLYTEMAALFPDKFFHIGGDENTGRDWQQTPHILAFMKEHHMAKYMDLQTYFNQRLLPIIRSKGKIMMGWDEILQPGVPKDIVIQSWRGADAFYESLRNGYRAILSYGYYIDLIQPASYHYQNEPIPDSVHLTEAEAANLLGGEATMWSELVSPETVDSRIWPRTGAIAERLWSPRVVKDTDDMYRRLDVISLELDGLGLRHLSNQAVMMRRLCNGENVGALKTLVDVIEPLKIYERNQGDTLYNVFSPLTKLADVAIPDQPVARHFNQWVAAYLSTPNPSLADTIVQQLQRWKDNDPSFRRLLEHSPVLQEAAPLSASLTALATAGLQSMRNIQEHRPSVPDWIRQQETIIRQAREQSGRCELQIVTAIENLVVQSGKP